MSVAFTRVWVRVLWFFEIPKKSRTVDVDVYGSSINDETTNSSDNNNGDDTALQARRKTKLLRLSLRGATEEQTNTAIEKSIVVFCLLSDKDVFEHLAKRLLNGRSVSDDAERAMVSLLKAECGY